MKRREAWQDNVTFVSPRTGARLTVEKPPPGDPDAVVVKRVFRPDGGRAPEHIHLDFAEQFVIKKGTAEAKLEDLTLRLGTGEVLYVPKGVRHVNPYNRDATDLEVQQSFLPGEDEAKAYVLTLGEYLRDGRDHEGELPPLALLAVFDATRGSTYLSRVPVWPQQKLLLPLGARLAKRCHHEVLLTR